MARPIKDSVRRDDRITIRISGEMKRAIVTLAQEKDVTVNDMVLELLRKGLEAHTLPVDASDNAEKAN